MDPKWAEMGSKWTGTWLKCILAEQSSQTGRVRKTNKIRFVFTFQSEQSRSELRIEQTRKSEIMF